MKAYSIIYKLFCVILSFQLVLLSFFANGDDVWSQSKKYVNQTEEIASQLATVKFNGAVSKYFEEISKFKFIDKDMVLLNQINSELDDLMRQFKFYSENTEKELSLKKMRALRKQVQIFSKKVNVFFDKLSSVALKSTVRVTDLHGFITSQFSFIQSMCSNGWQPTTLDLCKLPMKEVHAPDFNFYMSVAYGKNGQGATSYYNSSLSEEDRGYLTAGTVTATALTYGYLVSGTSYALIGGTAAGLNMSAMLLASAYVAVAVLVVAAVIHIASKNKYYRETQKIVNAQYYTFKHKATPESVNKYIFGICDENKEVMNNISNLSKDIQSGKFSPEEIISDFQMVREEISKFSKLQSEYRQKWTEIAKKKGVYSRLNELKAKEEEYSNKDEKYAQCTEPTEDEKEIEKLEEKIMSEFESTSEYKSFTKVQRSWDEKKKLEMSYYALRASLFSAADWEKNVKAIAAKAKERVSPNKLRELQKKISQLIKLKKQQKKSSFFKDSTFSLEKYTFKLFKAILWNGVNSLEYSAIKLKIEEEKNKFEGSDRLEQLTGLQKKLISDYWSELNAI